MSAGRLIRRLLGPLERPTVQLYRSSFVNLRSLSSQVRRWVQAADRIVEVGCGDGLLCEQLAVAFPEAKITGIDVVPLPGRLFRGDRARVEFATGQIDQDATGLGHASDLAVVCDVLHHVPRDQWHRFLAGVRQAVRPGGWVVIKEWEKRRNPAYYIGWASDRYVTGDRITYLTYSELLDLVRDVFGMDSIRSVAHIPPCSSNNLAILIHCPAATPDEGAAKGDAGCCVDGRRSITGASCLPSSGFHSQ